jgi:hypothetical protein
MSIDVELYAKLRAQTAQLLGFDLGKGMTASQVVRLDRTTTLRLLADDLQSRAVRGENIDIAQFNEIMSELEKLLGGDPQQAKARDFTGARIKIENMLDRLIAERKRKEAQTGRCTHCGALLVRSDASEEQQATPLDRLNMLRAAVGTAPEEEPEATAAPDQEAAAAALAAASAQSPPSQLRSLSPPSPPAEPPQQTSSQPPLPRRGEIPRHYLADYSEPWRPFSHLFVQ